MRALAQKTAFARIVPRLRALGIRPLLIKGPVTARLLGLRHHDLLGQRT